jgi:hypothetical protein
VSVSESGDILFVDFVAGYGIYAILNGLFGHLVIGSLTEILVNRYDDHHQYEERFQHGAGNAHPFFGVPEMVHGAEGGGPVQNKEINQPAAFVGQQKQTGKYHLHRKYFHGDIVAQVQHHYVDENAGGYQSA